MFSKKPAPSKSTSPPKSSSPRQAQATSPTSASPLHNRPILEPTIKKNASPTQPGQSSVAPSKSNNLKRSFSQTSNPSTSKKAKIESNGTTKGQQSLKGFFTMPPPKGDGAADSVVSSPEKNSDVEPTPANSFSDISFEQPTPLETSFSIEDYAAAEAASFETRKSWGKLFAKPIAPKCDHSEPCKTMLTKKPGANCGRSFWMCARPLGPSGNKERGTQWRCHTFIWASDWDARQDPG